MPRLILKTNKILEPQEKQFLVNELTKLTSKYLNKNPEVTMVLIQDSLDDWYVNNKSIRNSYSFNLSIQVTTNSNNESEKREWINSTYYFLCRKLEINNELPNYISIIDIDEDSWGFNGLTQKSRYK